MAWLPSRRYISGMTSRLTVNARIGSPATDIFAIITDPQGHVDIDGSGMLVAPSAGSVVQAEGDTFEIAMYRDFTGAYTVINTITRYEQDAALEWRPGAPGRRPIGHLYGYQLTPVSATETDVTSYYDWSAISDKWQALNVFPVVSSDQLAASLEKLAGRCRG
jgi:hypothetical protein